MPLLQTPEVKDFFDNRLIISVRIIQPQETPPPRTLTFNISGSPPLVFDPLQDPQIIISELNGNDLIINWVIRKPSTKTEVVLDVKSDSISEKLNFVIDADT